MFVSLVCSLLVLGALARLAVLAVRDEYLVVLRWPKLALFFLEREEGSRYRVVRPGQLPFVLARFTGHLVWIRTVGLWRWTVARAGSLLPFPLGTKA